MGTQRCVPIFPLLATNSWEAGGLRGASVAVSVTGSPWLIAFALAASESLIAPAFRKIDEA